MAPIPEGLAPATFWLQGARIRSGAPCTTVGIDLADAFEIKVG
jgi:hypothetical protein